MSIFPKKLSLFFNRNYLQSEGFLRKNLKFKNIHKGKRCFIIGNGISLSGQNLMPLAKEITFVMNAFWKHQVISSRWQPTYYCFADPVTFDGTDPWKNFFKMLSKKIFNSTFFIPYYGKVITEKQKLLPIEKTYFVSFKNSHDNIPAIDLTNDIPSVQSTSQLAVEIAIYMGCSPIYLLGMDHDWLAHRGKDRHFYEGKTVENHSIAYSDLSRDSYKNELESCLKLWKNYEYLKIIANKKGIKIYNLTEGGFLDVFPRKNYNEVI